MGEIDCRKIREGLSAYLEGDLDTVETESTRAHLEGCAACRAELELQRLTVGALRRTPDLPAPAGILAGVRTRLQPEPWYRRLAGGRRWLLGVPVGAVATVLVVIGVSLFQSHFSETGKMGTPTPLPTYPQPAATAVPTTPAVPNEPQVPIAPSARTASPVPTAPPVRPAPVAAVAPERKDNRLAKAKDGLNERVQLRQEIAAAPSLDDRVVRQPARGLAPRDRDLAALEESDAKTRAIGGERSTISRPLRLVCLLSPGGGTIDDLKRLLERAGAGEVRIEALEPRAVLEAYAPHRDKRGLPREAAGCWDVNARVPAQALDGLMEELASRPGLRILEEPADIPAAVDSTGLLELKLTILQ